MKQGETYSIDPDYLAKAIKKLKGKKKKKKKMDQGFNTIYKLMEAPDEKILDAIFSDAFYYIFIGDVHGRMDKLQKALDDSNSWLKRNKVSKSKYKFVFGGDYIDRGPDHRAVVMLVKEYVVKTGAVCLLGNHDEFLLGTANESSTTFDSGQVKSNSFLWAINDGADTCKALYGERPTHYKDGKAVTKLSMGDPSSQVSAYRDVIKDSEEYKFLKEHALYEYETPGIFFCHAPQSDVKNITHHSLIWGHSSDFNESKNDDIFKTPRDKYISVHGHFHRLTRGINFPRIHYYKHGGMPRTVVLADCGAGCGRFGELHPVIIREYTMGSKLPELVAIL